MGLGGIAALWRQPIVVTRGHWLGLAFFAYCAASIFWAMSRYDAEGTLALLAFAALAFFLGANSLDLAQAYRSFAIGMQLSALLAIFQRLGFEPLSTIGGNPISGLFFNHDLMAESAAIALVGIIGDKRGLVLIPGLLACMFLPDPIPRGALLGVGAGWAIWMLSCAPSRLAAAIPIGAAAILIAWLSIDSMGGARLVSLDTRFEAWNWALANLRWWGWGLGSYATIFAAFGFAHNEFVQSAFELGIGAVLLWAFLAYALAQPAPRERAVLGAVMAIALVGFPFHAPAEAFMAALVAGRLCRVGDDLRRRRVPSRAAGLAGECAVPFRRYPSAGL